MKKLPVHYVWDISSEQKDGTHIIYAVEYKGDPDGIPFDDLEIVINKARRKAYELFKDRKCMRQTNEGFHPYSTSCKIIKVPYATKPLKKWIGKIRKAFAIYDGGDEFDYENFLYILEEKMAGHKYFKINGRNLDWLHHDGSKFIYVDGAQELVNAFYKEDIIYLYNGKRKDEFEINSPTHDTPMGSFYYFTPISERTYNKNI